MCKQTVAAYVLSVLCLVLLVYDTEGSCVFSVLNISLW